LPIKLTFKGVIEEIVEDLVKIPLGGYFNKDPYSLSKNGTEMDLDDPDPNDGNSNNTPRSNNPIPDGQQGLTDTRLGDRDLNPRQRRIEHLINLAERKLE
jgi:hypothetical protein